MMKKMLSQDDLIKHLKNKGIKFNLIKEDTAKKILTNNNYYMKLGSYRNNYDKFPNTHPSHPNEYKALEFAYLQELSKLDMSLRYYIIQMCLDIEHIIKVKLISKASDNNEEDGYKIVRKFLAEDEKFRILQSISKHKSGDYCKSLIERYYPYFPIWVFVELISFGDLLHFCNFYEKTYNDSIVNNKLMNTIRDLRNAAAHSNCILNQMTTKIDMGKQPDNEITSFLKQIPGISKDSRRNNIYLKFTYSFVTLIYVYKELMPTEDQQYRFMQIQEFMEKRVLEHKDYFSKNSKLSSIYNFLKKVIDFVV